MVRLWFVYGPFTVRLWSVHGPFTVRSRFVYGSFMVRSWSVYGPFMVRSRSVHGSFMVRSWSVHGPFMVRSRFVYGPFMVRLWSVHGPFMVRSWSVHGLRQGGLYTYGLRIYFPVFLSGFWSGFSKLILVASLSRFAGAFCWSRVPKLGAKLTRLLWYTLGTRDEFTESQA